MNDSKRQTISLCMIVRDEADHLEQCLASVRDVVDEIVIVDTGSADQTVLIAEAFGAYVLHEKWTDDFSAARNAGLSVATGQWILVLDADEVIAKADHGAVRKAVRRLDVDGYTLRTRNYVNDRNVANAVANTEPPPEGEGFPAWTPSDKVRLFRNQPHARFEGLIHELVGDAIRAVGGCIDFLDVPIHHYGFVLDDSAKESKLRMQRRIADRKTEQAPGDFKAWWELGVIAHRQGDLDAALYALQTSVSLHDHWAENQFELAHVFEDCGRVVEAIATYEKALRIDETHVSTCLNLGGLHFQQSDHENAARTYRLMTEHAPSDARGWNSLGAVLGQLGKYEEATEAWCHALRVDPHNTEATKNLETLRKMRDKESPPGVRASLCMIVRDEEANLAEALNGIRRIVDEIIVVDTGSADDTVAIAESFGATVVHFPWCDDFAAARNVGIEHASGEWIVWLDADDRMDENALAALRRALDAPAEAAVQWCVRSRSGGKEPVEFLQLRQFPRRKDIRFSGRIHENVLGDVRTAGLPICNAGDVVVRHVGYEDPTTLAKKHERNVRLLEVVHAETPDDPLVCHHLSQTYTLLGNTAKARQLSKHLLSLEPLEGDARYLGLQARVRLAQLASRVRKTDEAEALLQDALEIVPHFPPAEYLLGELLWKSGMVDDARIHLEAVSRAEMPLSEMPIPLPALRAGAHNILGRIAQDVGSHAEACMRFAAALEEAPGVAVIHVNYAESLKALGRTVDANHQVELARTLAPNDNDIASRCTALTNESTETDVQPLLSLCMIVRDEEQNLSELLPLVQAHVDELVIVDTGSKDKTVTLAESFGARVGQFPWCDDFAAARNVSLDMATGRWNLWLDADDRIDPATLSMMRSALSTLEPQAIRLPVSAAMPDGELTMLSVRVFPGNRGIRFAGRVHEDVGPSCTALGITIADNHEVEIHHIGYGDEAALKEKFARNRRLLTQQLEDEPENVRAALYLVGADMYFGDLDAARKRVGEVLQRTLTPRERGEALRFQCALLRESGEDRQWRDAAREWLRLMPGNADAVVGTAAALAAHGAWSDVKRVLEQTPAKTLQPGNVPADIRALRLEHGVLRGRAYRELGMQTDAVDALSDVLHAAPEHPEALFELANVHWDTQRWADADAAYAQLLRVKPDHAPGLVQRGNLAFQRGDYEQAETLYAQALAHDPHLRAARENACAVALQLGNAPLARARLTSALHDYPDAMPLRVYLADLDFGEGRYGPALDGYRRYLTERPTDVKALTRLGDCLRHLGHQNEARTAYTAVLRMDGNFALAADGLRALQTA